jgi:hypothetical protein
VLDVAALDGRPKFSAASAQSAAAPLVSPRLIFSRFARTTASLRAVTSAGSLCENVGKIVRAAKVT